MAIQVNLNVSEDLASLEKKIIIGGSDEPKREKLINIELLLTVFNKSD